jgi:two-component system phosphate regulon sensor histidine kinase PhoR
MGSRVARAWSGAGGAALCALGVLLAWRAGNAWWAAGSLAAGLAAGWLLRMARADDETSGGRREGANAEPARDDAGVRVLLDGVPSPVIGVDESGVVVACNRAAETFFGRSGLAGRMLEDLFTHQEVFLRHSAALRGERGQTEIRLGAGEGARRYELTAEPVRRTGRIVVVLTLRDVTQLAEAVQLKTDFVANASHELRTPVASIRAAAETLAGGAWEDPAMRERLIGMIAQHSERLEELVRDLLDLSQLESPAGQARAGAVTGSEVARGLVEMFEEQARARNLRLSMEFDPRLERMWTDARLLNLVLRNLVENAVKFAYEGTTVRVVGEVDAGASREGRAGARFRVIDCGIGIPVAIQSRIFERFFQADAARSGRGRGTGLGLAIVKHAVRVLGGTVEVESVWKEGTEMRVVLPGVVEAEEREGEAAEPRGNEGTSLGSMSDRMADQDGGR